MRQIPGAELVRVDRFTGLGGSLKVHGEVPNEQTAEVVIREVIVTAPPVTVDFTLIAARTNTVWRIVEPTTEGNSRPTGESSGY
ncbi:MAG: hypothetical protein ACK4UN_17395 [Limisphaerales bacterium]